MTPFLLTLAYQKGGDLPVIGSVVSKKRENLTTVGSMAVFPESQV